MGTVAVDLVRFWTSFPPIPLPPIPQITTLETGRSSLKVFFCAMASASTSCSGNSSIKLKKLVLSYLFVFPFIQSPHITNNVFYKKVIYWIFFIFFSGVVGVFFSRGVLLLDKFGQSIG